MKFEHGETITVSRPGGFDRNGDPLEPAEHVVAGCAVYDARTSEKDAGAVVNTDYVMLAPYDVDVEPNDTIYREADTAKKDPLYVQGDVARWKSPFSGWESGAEVFLSRQKG